MTLVRGQQEIERDKVSFQAYANRLESFLMSYLVTRVNQQQYEGQQVAGKI